MKKIHTTTFKLFLLIMALIGATGNISANHGYWDKGTWKIYYEKDGVSGDTGWQDKSTTVADVGNAGRMKLTGYGVKTWGGTEVRQMKVYYNANGNTGNHGISNDGNDNNKTWEKNDAWGVDLVTSFSATSGNSYDTDITFKINDSSDEELTITLRFTYSQPEYHVAGDGWCGTSWCANCNDNKMSVNSSDPDYSTIQSITFNNVGEGDHLFKVTSGSWSNPVNCNATFDISKLDSDDSEGCDGTSNNNIKLTLAGTRNVTVAYDGSKVYIRTVSPCTAPTAQPVYIGDGSSYSKTICSTGSTFVRLADSQSGYSYQLKKQNGESWDDVGDAWSSSGGSHDFDDDSNGISTAGNYKITGYPTGSENLCNADMSNHVILYVDQVSVAGDITNYGNKCQGSTVTLGISGNTGTTYQWQSCSTEGGVYTDIKDEDESEYDAPTSGSVGSTIYYKIKVKNGVCDWATSATGRPVTILPTPTNLSFTANATVCMETDKTFTLTHDAAPTGSTYSYEWTYPTTSNWSKKSGGTSSDASAVITVGTANGTVKVKPTLTTSSVGCLGTEKSSVITVQGPTNYSINATPASGYTPWKPVTLSTSTSASAAWSITSPSPVGTAYLSTESGSSTKLKAPDNNGGSGTSYTVSATVTSSNCSLTRTKTITVTAPDCD